MLFSRFFLLICFNLCCLFLESNVTRNSLLRFTNYFQCFFKIKYETLERRSNFFFMYTKSKTFFSTIFIFTFSKMYFYIFSHSTKKWKLFFLMNVFFSSSNYFMMRCVDYFYYETLSKRSSYYQDSFLKQT